ANRKAAPRLRGVPDEHRSGREHGPAIEEKWAYEFRLDRASADGSAVEVREQARPDVCTGWNAEFRVRALGGNFALDRLQPGGLVVVLRRAHRVRGRNHATLRISRCRDVTGSRRRRLSRWRGRTARSRRPATLVYRW